MCPDLYLTKLPMTPDIRSLPFWAPVKNMAAHFKARNKMFSNFRSTKVLAKIWIIAKQRIFAVMTLKIDSY